MSRISYRCLPEERGTPISEKSFWHVYKDGTCIGKIDTEGASTISPNLRIWNPVLFESEFDPFEFPHADSREGMTEAFVTTNDEPEYDHQLELQPNTLMTLHESRMWIRNITRSE